MRTRLASILLALCGIALAQDQMEVLERIGVQLRESRETSERSLCPTDLDQLTGLDRNVILEALGDPDFCSVESSQSCAQAEQWSYFFTEITDFPLQRGGGFPELSVFFDASASVSRAQCAYAR